MRKKIALKFSDVNVSFIDSVIKELKDSGFLNERKTVLNLFKWKMESGWGKRKIKQYLIFRGFRPEIVDEVLLSVEFDYSYIVRTLKRKYDLGKSKEMLKAKRFLLQRGFSFLEIQSLLNC
ncbi:MAG: RecX family transcriptional regulator [Desulfurobacteriaceae bacterium]